MVAVACATVRASSSQWLDRDQRINARVIRLVWPARYEEQAVRVAYCEGRLRRWAHNGQYLGMFQMGSYARARYGHRFDAWTQARAALRYFNASGRDWSPWTCKP